MHQAAATGRALSETPGIAALTFYAATVTNNNLDGSALVQTLSRQRDT